MKTLLREPLLAIQLINLCDAGRITKELCLEAMDQPELAKQLVMHEAMHDYFRTVPEARTRKSQPSGEMTLPQAVTRLRAVK